MNAAAQKRFTHRALSLSEDVRLDTQLSVDGASPSIKETTAEDEESDDIFPESPKRKLILHFDARNTVFVADLFSRITIEQALNTYLAGLAWGTEDESGKWTGFSSELSLTAPDPDAVSLYKHMERKLVHTPSDRGLLRKRLGAFTQSPEGALYESIFQRHLSMLRWPATSAKKADSGLTVQGNDGRPYHYLLPAWLHLIEHMRTSGRDFCVVVRTFGRDAPHILSAVTKFAAGQHPDFPGPRPDLCIDHNVHRFKRFDDGGFAYSYQPAGGAEEPTVLTSVRAIYEHWNRCSGVVAVVDDFEYWQRNQYHYTAAKPLWFSQRDRRVQHILFDDNIRVADDDNILNLCRLVNVDRSPSHAPACRILSAGGHRPSHLLPTNSSPALAPAPRRRSRRRAGVDLEPVLASRYEDVFFVQADLLGSTSDPRYFIDKVALCEANFDRLFGSAR